MRDIEFIRQIREKLQREMLKFPQNYPAILNMGFLHTVVAALLEGEKE